MGDKKSAEIYVTDGSGYPVTESELLGRYNDDRRADAVERADEEGGGVEQYITDFDTPKPERNQFIPNGYESDIDYLKKMFPSISKEEEDERTEQYYRNKNTLNWGRAAAALANLVGVGFGGSHAELPQTKVPDIVSWRAGEQNKRAQNANAAMQINSTFQNAYNNWLAQKNQADLANKRMRMQYRNTVDKRANDIIAQENWEDKFEAQKYNDAYNGVSLINKYINLPSNYKLQTRDGRLPSYTDMRARVIAYETGQKPNVNPVAPQQSKSSNSGKKDNKKDNNSHNGGRKSSGKNEIGW